MKKDRNSIDIYILRIYRDVGTLYLQQFSLQIPTKEKNNMQKRLIALLLCLGTLCLMLAGCGSNTASVSDQSAPVEASEPEHLP